MQLFELSTQHGTLMKSQLTLPPPPSFYPVKSQTSNPNLAVRVEPDPIAFIDGSVIELVLSSASGTLDASIIPEQLRPISPSEPAELASR